MKSNYSPEVKQRAIRLLQEQRSQYPTQWAAIVAIAAKIGCSAETLCSRIRRYEADMADNGQALNDAQHIKQLEKENKE